MFINNGSGGFVDATPPSMASRGEPTRGVVAFDMDRDGDLDIFTVSGWRGSGDPSGERNELYRNDGNLQFSARTSGSAFDAPAGQGATDTDYDGDGDIDLIAGNRDGDLNVLRNDGAGNFSLVNPAAIGIQHRAYSGITMGDIDQDGDLDLVMVGLDSRGAEIGHLYRNVGNGMFTFLRTFNDVDGFMDGFADVDHDGDLDLLFAGQDVMFLNDGTGGFSTGPAVPVSGISDPRAIAFADIDDDGDLDFAVGAKNSRNWLARNDANGGTWLKVADLVERAGGCVRREGGHLPRQRCGPSPAGAPRSAQRQRVSRAERPGVALWPGWPHDGHGHRDLSQRQHADPLRCPRESNDYGRRTHRLGRACRRAAGTLAVRGASPGAHHAA